MGIIYPSQYEQFWYEFEDGSSLSIYVHNMDTEKLDHAGEQILCECLDYLSGLRCKDSQDMETLLGENQNFCTAVQP